MNRVFVTADTHFGHKNICKFEPTTRPFNSIEEHDVELVRRWNSVVKPKDTVWHLGDVLFGRDSFETLGLLNGRKHLVMGNHDGYPSEHYLDYFDRICGSVKLRDCILTHIPVHPVQFNRFKANIHGHMHNYCLEDKRYINVSMDQTNLTPVLLDTVLYNFDKLNGG